MYYLFFVCIWLKNGPNRVKWRHKIRPIANNFRPILIFFARDAKLMPGEVCQVSCRYSNKWRSYSGKKRGGGRIRPPLRRWWANCSNFANIAMVYSNNVFFTSMPVIFGENSRNREVCVPASLIFFLLYPDSWKTTLDIFGWRPILALRRFDVNTFRRVLQNR